MGTERDLDLIERLAREFMKNEGLFLTAAPGDKWMLVCSLRQVSEEIPDRRLVPHHVPEIVIHALTKKMRSLKTETLGRLYGTADGPFMQHIRSSYRRELSTADGKDEMVVVARSVVMCKIWSIATGDIAV